MAEFFLPPLGLISRTRADTQSKHTLVLVYENRMTVTWKYLQQNVNPYSNTWKTLRPKLLWSQPKNLKFMKNFRYNIP